MWASIERAMERQVRRVRPLPLRDADPTVQAIAAEIARDFGAFVPPFALHAPAPTVLAACWTMVRESLVTGHLDRRAKEAVASAVSRLNACTYCVDAHTTALHALGDAATADALADPAAALHRDDPLLSTVAWASATRSPGAAILAKPPFTAAQMPEAIGIALSFHYINRMVAIFLTPALLPIRGRALKTLARRLLRPAFTRMVTRRLRPDDGIRWLPDAPAASDLAWAARSPTIAAAFARSAASFDAAARGLVAPRVRELVTSRLRVWRAEEPGLGRGWLDDATAGLAPDERAAARLLLLTALAPSQVDDAVVADFARVHPGDAALIAATAWASFAAARRIGEWLLPRETGLKEGW